MSHAQAPWPSQSGEDSDRRRRAETFGDLGLTAVEHPEVLLGQMVIIPLTETTLFLPLKDFVKHFCSQ